MGISCGLSQQRESRELSRIPKAPASAAACISASRKAHSSLSRVTRRERCVGEAGRLVGTCVGSSSVATKQSACDRMALRWFWKSISSKSYALPSGLRRGSARQPHITNALANGVRGPAKDSMTSGAAGSVGPIICSIQLSPRAWARRPWGPITGSSVWPRKCGLHATWSHRLARAW